MFLCRAAWPKFRPVAQKSITPLSKNVAPARSMAYGLPGASGQNVAYAVLCGGSLTAALVYVYKMLMSDSERYTKRMAELNARPKDPWESKPWPVKSGGDEIVDSSPVAEETMETNEETTLLAHNESIVTEADVMEVVGADVAVVAVTETTEVTADAEVVEVEFPAEVPENAMLIPSEVATEVLTKPTSDVAAEAVLVIATEEASVAQASVPPVKSNVVMSDLVSTMKIITGSTVEIAAASVDDSQLMSSVKVLENRPQGLDFLKAATSSDSKDQNTVPQEETSPSECAGSFSEDIHGMPLYTKPLMDIKAEDEEKATTNGKDNEEVVATEELVMGSMMDYQDAEDEVPETEATQLGTDSGVEETTLEVETDSLQDLLLESVENLVASRKENTCEMAEECHMGSDTEKAEETVPHGQAEDMEIMTATLVGGTAGEDFKASVEQSIGGIEGDTSLAGNPMEISLQAAEIHEDKEEDSRGDKVSSAIVEAKDEPEKIIQRGCQLM